ncbi:MAG: protein kinase [Polyangiaceae bacterium]|nr:protein kinase [Polyangiaceae bacterium]
MMAPIALGSTARVDLCRSLGPAQPGAMPQNPGATAGQLLAVKRPLPELSGDENVGKRFLDEVWMTASLRHPNVVGVVGWGQDDVGPYLAVELVQGVSLARLMKSVFETGEQFSERLVVYVGTCVARGLAAAHDLRSERGTPLQLVHRDLTAANVLLSFQGEVKVADFGLAKAKDRLTVTTSELPTRSMGHVAPEELAQLPSDHRSDLFSFGVMLFELLTGRQPFKGKDDLATLESIMRHAPPDPLELRPKMDRTLAALVLRCLEKAPERRYHSAREIVHELDRWLDAHGYRHDNHEVLARFVRRNSMRQMRWFERVIAGEPAPAPNPQAPPKLSLYDPAADGPVPATTSTSDSGRRTDEPTLVDRPRPKAPTARRSRSTESFAALQKTRRLNEGPGVDLPDFADPETDDEVPTIAIRMDNSTRDALRDGKLKELPRNSPIPPRPETRGPLGTETMNDTSNAFFAGRQAPPQKGSVLRVVEREIERLRELAGERHEAARTAREKARIAVLEAERAEAQARIVERAMGGVRQAHEAAVRGQNEEAERRLDEALELLATQRRT